jgi:hypothetical protein
MANERGREAAARPGAEATPPAQVGQTRVVWDDSKMRSSYANVANVSSTREEVVLLFGTNHAWHSGQREVKIELTDRIILSPFAAKRLSLLLSNLVREYEGRFGALPVGTGDQAAPQG